MPQEIIRTEQSVQGGRLVHTTTRSTGEAEAIAGGLIIAAAASTVAFPLWVLYKGTALAMLLKFPALMGAMLTVPVIALIAVLFIGNRPCRRVYIVINAIVLMALVYSIFRDELLGAMFAAIVFMAATVIGFLCEPQLHREIRARFG